MVFAVLSNSVIRTSSVSRPRVYAYQRKRRLLMLYVAVLAFLLLVAAASVVFVVTGQHSHKG
jgi:hypothetical protein